MRRLLSATIGVVLTIALIPPVTVSAAAAKVPGTPQQERPVPVEPVPVKQPPPDATEAAAIRTAPDVEWPTARATGARVEVTDRAGVQGLLLRVRRTDGVAQAGPVTLT